MMLLTLIFPLLAALHCLPCGLSSFLSVHHPIVVLSPPYPLSLPLRIMLSKLLVVTALAAATTVLAGSSFMPPLPKEVLADLAKRDPSEYQTFTLRDESFIDRDRDNDGLVKRKVPKSLKGLQYTCKKADCMSITFDDGPYINMRSIVDTALAASIKVTFFLNSYNYGCSYDEEYTSQ